MGRIIHIFKTDIRKLVKSRVAVVILIGLIFIPGIYAWLNIDSNWNPYSNTGALPIAIVNLDEGYTFVDKEMNIGNMLTKSLKDNTDMKWIFIDNEDEAIARVNASEYYGAIIIPKEFTSKIATLFDEGEIEKPKCVFYVNDKKNPIAPIIVSKAVSTIQTKVNEAFVDALVFQVINEADSMNIADMGASSTQDIVESLNKVKSQVGQLQATLGTLSIAAKSSSSVLDSVRDLLPSVQNVSDSSMDSIKNMQNILNSFDGSYGKIAENMVLVIDSAKEIFNDVHSTVSNMDSGIDVTDELTIAKEKLERLSTVLTKFDDVLKTLDSNLNLSGIKNVITETETALNQVNEMKDKVNKALDEINTNNEVKEETLKQLKEISDELDSNMAKIQDEFENKVVPSLNSLVKNSSSALSSTAKVVTGLNTAMGNGDKALANLVEALNNTEELTNNINTVLQGVNDNIDLIIKEISGAKQSEIYSKIVQLLENSPSEVADFISTPVETEEIGVYKIETYGSKMAPFYTILATWVGGTLLVSIVKTTVKPDEKLGEPKLYQEFFGRFFIFGTTAVLQGLVIAIGDIVLGVQVINYPLFILTCMLSSLVFMLIIYSLTISFGKVGEAASVVLLVIQVAGSGGTFPIELLPRMFQVFQPFMPFYPAMNALRETIGGFYGNEYIINIGILLCHTIIPLILGVALRKPIKALKDKLSKKLEETDLIA